MDGGAEIGRRKLKSGANSSDYGKPELRTIEGRVVICPFECQEKQTEH